MHIVVIVLLVLYVLGVLGATFNRAWNAYLPYFSLVGALLLIIDTLRLFPIQ